jgi:putative acetyltransferase
MIVRRFREGDEPALLDVFRSSVRDVASRDYAPEQIEAWAPDDVAPQAWAARIRAIAPFVVESEGELIAYADVQENGYIEHFFVSGRHQHRGAGRLLMERIHQRAAANRLAALTADVSRTAQPFFEHFGFTLVEERMPWIRGVRLPNALMCKRLIDTAMSGQPIQE